MTDGLGARRSQGLHEMHPTLPFDLSSLSLIAAEFSPAGPLFHAHLGK